MVSLLTSSGDGYGYGSGCGFGYGFGDGCGCGDGFGSPMGTVAGVNIYMLAPWQLVRAGCEVHSVEHWREHWREIAAQNGVDVPAEEAEAWLERIGDV